MGCRQWGSGNNGLIEWSCDYRIALVNGWCDGEKELGLFDGDKGGILDSVEHKRIYYYQSICNILEWPSNINKVTMAVGKGLVYINRVSYLIIIDSTMHSFTV
jgi:hypothetical protein